MNENCATSKSCCACLLSTAGWAIGILGSFALIGGLAMYSVKRNPTEGLEAQREVIRYQARREVEGASAEALNKFAIDATKENKAQLSVGRAMEIMVTEWKDDTTAGRAKLLERLEASKKAPSFD